MPPRLQLLSGIAGRSAAQPASYQPLAPFLYPFLSQQRSASILSSLSDNKGAYSKRIRVGRGPSSGYGKTSGRGHKGQKQHGKVPVGFNGGQTPDWAVSGSRGEANHFSTMMSPVNLNKIQFSINKGRLDPTKPITLRELSAANICHGVAKDGIKLLARGKQELTTPINIIVSRASAEAISAVEAVGGTVTTRYYTPFAVKKILKREMDPVNSLQGTIVAPPARSDKTAEAKAMLKERRRYKFRLPDPTSRKHLEYYRDAAHRGYLSHKVAEGHGPSLFFKTPGMGAAQREGGKKVVKKAASGGGGGGGENRLW